jgi:hypothetical protein
MGFWGRKWGVSCGLRLAKRLELMATAVKTSSALEHLLTPYLILTTAPLVDQAGMTRSMFFSLALKMGKSTSEYSIASTLA